MKLSRRGMLTLAAGSVALAQAPQPAPANPDPLAKARDDNRRAAETLTKFEIPMSAEPAFVFRP